MMRTRGEEEGREGAVLRMVILRTPISLFFGLPCNGLRIEMDPNSGIAQARPPGRGIISEGIVWKGGPVSIVRISGWRIGARTISAVTELKASTALGPLGAKNAIYDIIGGVCVSVTPLQGVDPEGLAARLTECGFVATVQPSLVVEEPVCAANGTDSTEAAA
jgi:hypothetical protein